ncbi:hypothetical protein LY13_003495 [Prauserella aidingensis]|nr:hypothetical protein [Prauserella aidingensis]
MCRLRYGRVSGAQKLAELRLGEPRLDELRLGELRSVAGVPD